MLRGTYYFFVDGFESRTLLVPMTVKNSRDHPWYPSCNLAVIWIAVVLEAGTRKRARG